MKNLRLLFCLSFVVLFVAGCAVKTVVPKDMVLASSASQAELAAVLKHGDWIVIRGVSGPDNFIAGVTNAALSHSVIYDAQSNEIIEADSHGVHTTPLAGFLGKAHRALVIRPLWADEARFAEPDKEAARQNAREAVQLARSWLGRPYNYTGLVGLNIPDRYYCTQLSLMAYKPAMQREREAAGGPRAENPVPPVIEPAQMYHWGRIVYDSGPYRDNWDDQWNDQAEAPAEAGSEAPASF